MAAISGYFSPTPRTCGARAGILGALSGPRQSLGGAPIDAIVCSYFKEGEMRSGRIILSTLALTLIRRPQQPRSASLSFEGLSAEFCAEPYSCVEQLPLADQQAQTGSEPQERREVNLIAHRGWEVREDDQGRGQ